MASKNQDWSALSVEELEKALQYHNAKYWVENAPEISDPEFDKLVEALRAKAPDSAVLDAIGAAGAGLDDGEELGDGVRVRHEHPMLSLDKCYDEAALKKWFDKFDGDAVVSPKVDGCAISIKYDADGKLVIGATRGNGTIGELITDNIKHIENIPHQVPHGGIEVRGEAYMPISVFKTRYAGQYANPRNLAAGALKQKDAAKTGAYSLRFFAYDVIGHTLDSESAKNEFLKSIGFEPVDTLLTPHAQLQEAYDNILTIRASLDYETDGVVYKANSLAEQQRMGLTSHHPRYAIAYKFQGDYGQSVLRDVIWSVSRTGTINPVGIVDPVELSGASVTRVSLHNLAIMDTLGGESGLMLDSEVLMVRRGGVIPHLEKIVKAGERPVVLPANCPFCQAVTYRKGDFLMADHGAGCQTMKVRQLEHYTKTIEMKGFGLGVLERIFEADLVTEIADFYTLTADDLLTLDRVGKKLAEKLIEQIDASRALPAELFLQALGIHELGRHVSKILATRYDSIDAILAMTEEELAAIHTIGAVIAKHVTEGLAARKDEIEALLKHIVLSFGGAGSTPSAGGPGAFSGKKVLFTGAMVSMPRTDAIKQVEAQGGTSPSSVVKDLDFLVIGDEDLERYNTGWRSSKLKKAEQFIGEGAAMRIIGETEFLQILRGSGDDATTIDADAPQLSLI
jgi:DNA ligase (NAD+)